MRGVIWNERGRWESRGWSRFFVSVFVCTPGSLYDFKRNNCAWYVFGPNCPSIYMSCTIAFEIVAGDLGVNYLSDTLLFIDILTSGFLCNGRYLLLYVGRLPDIHHFENFV